MKAFIVAALLVASVASQSFDLKDLTKDRSIFRPNHKLSTIEELLLKEKLGNQQMMGYNTYKNFDMDLSHVFGGQQVNILSLESLESLVSHPIFQQYMQLPLFVKLWEEHPVVFRRYVESPLFQKFFVHPEFTMYFRNPVLFYKYIVPQVQMISQTMYPTTEGIYTTPKYTPFVQNRYQPTYNTEYSSVPTYGMNYNKYLLEKMYNHLNLNNQVGQDVTETEIKMLPTGRIQEQTFGKIVDPMTGEEKITVGDYKLVDEKIVPVDNVNFPKYQMDKIFGNHNTETIKDVLLKHIIFNKIFGEKKVTPQVYESLFETPEIYNTMFNSKKVVVPEMLETIFGDRKVVPEVYESIYDTKKVMTPEILETVFGNKKNILTPQVYEMLVGNKNIKMTPEIFEPVFGKKVYSPEVYGTLFGEQTTDLYNNDYYKYKMEEPTMFSMKNKMMMNPIVSRMLKNKKMNKFNQFNKMDLTTLKTIQKIQAEKMIEEIQKEKIMKELIKDTEIPKMMETEKYQHIPLTYVKPSFNQFTTEEKEIKNLF